MQRLIARILLVLLMMGTFVPVALAISAPTPHACCMRKMHERQSSRQASAADCCRHDCCRSVTVTSRVLTGPAGVVVQAPKVVAFASSLDSADRLVHFVASHRVRGPPSWPIS